MPSYRRTIPRIEWGASRLLFRYRAGDSIAALGGSFTRASTAAYFDADGVMRFAASGVLRDANYINGVRCTLLEEASGNLITQSADFSSWTSGGALVTTNQTLAPDGAVAVDLLDADVSASDSRYLTVSFTADGRKAFGLWLRQGSASATGFAIYDFTAGVFRHEVRVTWNAGVPTLSTIAGAGYLFVPFYNPYSGMWLCAANAAGVVAANVNRMYVYPDAVNGTGNVYAWGAQVENASTLSSYIPTSGTTATRAADDLSFPFTAAPQEMTVQYDGIELGLRVAAQTLANSFHLWTICDAATANPKLRMNCFSGTGRYQFQRTLASGTQVTTAPTSDSAQPNEWERFQARGVLKADGSIAYGIQAAGDGTETTSEVFTPNALDATWSGGGTNTRLYLNQQGSAGAQRNRTAVVSLSIAAGTHGMPRMRPVGAGGGIFANTLALGYALDEAVSYPRPAEGSSIAFLPSGAVDGWDAGTAYILEGVLRWIPRETGTTPEGRAATGWEGALGVQAFLTHARRGSRFWWCPDITDLSAGWDVALEAPFGERPPLESDMSRALPVTFRATSEITGY